MSAANLETTPVLDVAWSQADRRAKVSSAGTRPVEAIEYGTAKKAPNAVISDALLRDALANERGIIETLSAGN